MKVKVTKTLRTEQKTLHILLAVGIVAFLLSMLLELVVSRFICISLYEALHLNYFINILLGISCSAIISFIGLIFPYLNNKNGQIEVIINELNEIFERYLIIYGSISNLSDNDSKVETNDFSIEKSLYDHADELTQKIYKVISSYENSSFISEDIDEINKVFRNRIVKNLLAVKEFCSFFLLQEKSIKQNNSDTDLKESILKDVITKRAEKDCYKFLLNKIESLFSLESFTHIYKNILNSSNLNNYTIKQIEQGVKEYNAIRDMRIKFTISLQIQSEINEIRRKHEDAYNCECGEIIKRLHYIVEKRGKNITDIIKMDKSYIEEIFNAIENDDIQKAKDMLDVIENKINNIE